jgi:polyhydroxybutyrate depolymerase
VNVRLSLLISLCISILTLPACARKQAGDASIQQRTLVFRGTTYPFFVYSASVDHSRAMPAVLLLHGGGGNGRDFLMAWKSLAEKNGILLIAPTLPMGEETERRVPELFPKLVAQVEEEWNLDRSRIYLFGYSAGGYETFDGAMLNSTLFAAASVFAAMITPDYDWIIDRAQRKTPVAIYIGDRDQAIPLAGAQRTRDVLKKKGFTVHFVEIPDQDHNYGRVSGSVNVDAWKFMSQYRLANQ